MRTYCSACSFPESTCLCQSIRHQALPIDVVILQHSKEANHAKNTARLLILSADNVALISGNDEAAFADIAKQLSNRNTAVIYPGDQSKAIENEPKQGHAPDTLIVLDGSWRQATRLWHINPWLHHLPQFHFASAPPSSYLIRHTDFAKSLSTLEAVAYAETVLTGANMDALYDLQQAFISQWQGPQAHLRKH